MKKIFFVLLVSTFFNVNLSFGQSITFVDPTNGETIAYTAYGSTETTVPVNLNYSYQKSSGAISSYVKLIAHNGITQYSNSGGGIDQWWYLIPGTYTWKLELYDYFLGQGTFKTAESTITFYVKHTLEVKNDFNIGSSSVKIDNVTKTSGSKAYKFTGNNLSIGAIDQWYNGNYYLWDPSGIDQSKWGKKTKNSLSYTSISYDRNHNYTVQSNDNGVILNAFMKLDNPPAAPQNLSVTSTGQYTNPLVTWNANSESDLAGYKVYRKKDSGSWSHIETVTTNSYTDEDILAPIQFSKYTYKVSAFDMNDNISGYSNEDFIYGYKINKTIGAEEEGKIEDIPVEFLLLQNYPNPFNPTTRISYNIPNDEHVSIKVFNALGKEVAELVNGFKQKGKYSIQFDGSNLSSGIYYYEIRTNSFHSVKKMILTK